MGKTYTQRQIDAANALDIIGVAERLELPIKRQGRMAMTQCLWHSDSHPSLQLGGKAGYEHLCHCYVCGKSHNVTSLVMQAQNMSFPEAMAWLCSEYGIADDTAQAKPRKLWQPRQPLRPVVRMEGNYGTLADLRPYVSLGNALARCLQYRFPMEVVSRVTLDYYLGVNYNICRNDHTLFPSIDRRERVHHVKAQGYVTAPTSPLFGHSTKGDTYWVGQRLMEGRDTDTDCLFGEHLLPRHPDRTVVLVESPKNAVVGACQYPDLLWLATGSKGMLRRSLLEPLSGRQVIVMPDRDAVTEWTDKIAGMQDLATFQMSSFCACTYESEEKKLDIADVILK